MAKRRTTYGKLERDRAKRAKAAAKRERRQERLDSDEVDVDAEEQDAGPTVSLPQDEVLARLAEVHDRYEAGDMSFPDFEEAKAALLALLEVS